MAEPMLMGTSLSDDPLTALPLARRRYLEASRQIEELQSQQPDFSQAQEYARRQGDLGQTSLLNALAAQYAGEGFQPLQAKFLRQAEASQQPLRIGSTMILPTGEVVRDPNAERMQRLGALERRADTAAGDIRLLETAAERRAESAKRQQELIEAKQAEAERERKHKEEMARLIAFLRQPAGGRAVASTDVPQVGPSGIVPPNLSLRNAMGLQGFLENKWNQVAGMFGGGSPDDPNRVATAVMDALNTNLDAAFMAAFPGKSSVELLRRFSKHRIAPNELFTGVSSVPEKAKATVALIQDSAQRLREGLTVQNIAPNQRSQIMMNIMRLESLAQDYSQLAQAAASQTTFAAPQIAPQGGQVATPAGFPSRNQIEEEIRRRGLP